MKEIVIPGDVKRIEEEADELFLNMNNYTLGNFNEIERARFIQGYRLAMQKSYELQQENERLKEENEKLIKGVCNAALPYLKEMLPDRIKFLESKLSSLKKQDDGWISVEDHLPTKKDTCDDFYNEVLTLQLGTKRPAMMKYWEVKNSPFVKLWMPLPSPPTIK